MSPACASCCCWQQAPMELCYGGNSSRVLGLSGRQAGAECAEAYGDIFPASFLCLLLVSSRGHMKVTDSSGLSKSGPLDVAAELIKGCTLQHEREEQSGGRQKRNDEQLNRCSRDVTSSCHLNEDVRDGGRQLWTDDRV
ncbi:hypothetical protein JOB18_020080 [Solea senegalensis]|uniref:Uncharacterized protein n=1 Tax=Solea senegalensis TaxID=28829 RepID=A0AAV6RNL6_SOLSE|nr:hypothetical protein JOB18_020080 [Solea senegalensis]